MMRDMTDGWADDRSGDWDEDWIRARAYALWERDGRQHGKDRAHWDEAAREYAALRAAAADVTEKSKSRVRAAAGTTLAEAGR